MKRSDIITQMAGEVWAIMPERLKVILNILSSADAAVKLEAKRAVEFSRIKGNLAVIPIGGEIDQRASIWSMLGMGTSTEQVGRMVDAAMKDDSIGGIVFDIDSPGGSVYGVQELSAKIYDYRKTKPMVSVVNSLMASAAYWIGSAADEIVVTPGGQLGSIGVVALHLDFSEALAQMGIKPTFIHAGEHKVEGNAYEPLDDDARSHFQESVDDYYDMFTEDVARNRGFKQSVVKRDFGQGRVFHADKAVSVGMADSVATFEQVISDVLPKPTTMSRKAAAVEVYKRL